MVITRSMLRADRPGYNPEAELPNVGDVIAPSHERTYDLRVNPVTTAKAVNLLVNIDAGANQHELSTGAPTYATQRATQRPISIGTYLSAGASQRTRRGDYLESGVPTTAFPEARARYYTDVGANRSAGTPFDVVTTEIMQRGYHAPSTSYLSFTSAPLTAQTVVVSSTHAPHSAAFVAGAYSLPITATSTPYSTQAGDIFTAGNRIDTMNNRKPAPVYMEIPAGNLASRKAKVAYEDNRVATNHATTTTVTSSPHHERRNFPVPITDVSLGSLLDSTKHLREQIEAVIGTNAAPVTPQREVPVPSHKLSKSEKMREKARLEAKLAALEIEDSDSDIYSEEDVSADSKPKVTNWFTENQQVLSMEPGIPRLQEATGNRPPGRIDTDFVANQGAYAQIKPRYAPQGAKQPELYSTNMEHPQSSSMPPPAHQQYYELPQNHYQKPSYVSQQPWTALQEEEDSLTNQYLQSQQMRYQREPSHNPEVWPSQHNSSAHQPPFEQPLHGLAHPSPTEYPPYTQPQSQQLHQQYGAPYSIVTFGSQLEALAEKIAQKADQRPKCFELPIFNGSYQDWLSFKAAYDGSAPHLSPYENMNRLRKSLRGPAKNAVNRMLMFNHSPERVIQALELRFGRPDAIAQSEIDRLRALPRPGFSPKEICIFASDVVNIIGTLQELHQTRYIDNPEVMKQLLEKLPPTLQNDWFGYAYQRRHKPVPDLIKFADFLNLTATQCASYAQPEQIRSYSEERYRTAPSRIAGHTNARHNSGKIYTTVSQPQSRKPESSCPICDKQQHTISECRVFAALNNKERWEKTKNANLCYRCMKPRKNRHSCKKVCCNVNGCKRSHHPLLHFERKEETTITSGIVSTAMAKLTPQAYLKIVPVRVSGPMKTTETFALLDDGSTVTLVDESLAQEIGAQGPIEPMFVAAIANTELDGSKSRRVTLTLMGSNNCTEEIEARTFKDLHLSAQQIDRKHVEDCDHLVTIMDQICYKNVKPRILIGQDNWHLLIAQETRKGRRDQPVGTLTALGWALHGATGRTLGSTLHYTNHLVSLEHNMDEQLKHHFAIESLMINPKKPANDPEERALKILKTHTKQREDGRYETALLWKSEKIEMPENRNNALTRLYSTEKKIAKSNELSLKYEEQMEALLQKGYAEIAPEKPSPGKTWFLPHFPVINVMKPGKVRVVHDAAAKTKGVSLNDLLLTGPDLLQSLPGVLMRFRQHSYAVTGDIREMFMQVKIRPEDRDALRYLWRASHRREEEPQEYRMTSLIFGATSSPATAIFVKNLNAEKYKDTNPKAYNAIVKCHYVDDYLQSFATEEEAIKVAKDVDTIQKEAHYELRQWRSNSAKIQEAIGDENTMNVGIEDKTTTERVLGLIWKPTTDALTFNLDLARVPEDILNGDKATKRSILKVVMSLFDPLGFASIVTTRAKQLLQELWRRGTGWDDEIDKDLQIQYSKWLQHLKNLKTIAVPRCYIGYSEADHIQLHTFVDASEVAYAAALYWRVTAPNGDISTSLIVAKARVSPLKITSIPRLELQAAVMGARMAATVIEEHDRKPDEKIFWTDSRTVLAWLRAGARTFRPFVAHRIAAIEEHSKTNEWRWVPTKYNVADDATREIPSDLNNRHRWFHGPEFLKNKAEDWPVENIAPFEPTIEMKTHATKALPLISIAQAIPDSSRFSKWERFLRSTARVLQFIRLLRPAKHATYYKRTRKNEEIDPDWQRNKKKQKLPVKTNKHVQKDMFLPLDAKTLASAQELIFRNNQEISFPEEIKELSAGRPVNKNSRLQHLAVEITDGILRLKTRIDKAENISNEAKKPLILYGPEQSVKLYIDYVHRKLHHSSVETVVNECKQYYSIINLRPTVRSVINRCIFCRIRKSQPPSPPTGNHPTARLAHHQRPFSFVGLDYFGPVNTVVGRTTQKRYVALFTCLTTRAVHLELAASLSTDSAIMALRRMIARRGYPKQIWSDNGTNLQGADKELRRAIEAIQDEAMKKMIDWRFIPPGAPFMGGAWERLVRSVKKALNAALNERYPTDEVLSTLLAEAEYTVNSRPLTHVSVDLNDPEALTPNHFLLNGSAMSPSPGEFNEKDLIGRTNWRASQHLANMFWRRWVKEYLPELQHRREPQGSGEPIKEGNVVLIVDNNHPRNVWPRGIVTQTYPGPDNIVRAVDVKTKGGILRRPVKKLILLPTNPVASTED